MPQVKMNPSWTLFPDFIALVPMEVILGTTGTPPTVITQFDEITKDNSFVINDEAADTDLIMSEDGIEINYTLTSSTVQGFDEAGLGDVDDVNIQRELTINIGVNGFSHDILAILLGLDPETDIADDFQFLKDNQTGVEAAGVQLRNAIIKKKYFFIARIPLAVTTPSQGDLYVCSPKTVVMSQDIQHLVQPEKVKYNIPLKGLKLLNSDQLEAARTFSSAIANGSELLYWWNAANEAFPGS